MRPIKTAAGQLAIKERVPPLTPRLRSVLIVCDGHKTLAQLIEVARGLGGDEADVEHLIELGLIEVPVDSDAETLQVQPETKESAPASEDEPPSAEEAARRYAQAYPMATQLTAALGLRGFRLNLAVERAAGYAELRALLPQLRDALGAEKVRALERVLAPKG